MIANDELEMLKNRIVGYVEQHLDAVARLQHTLSWLSPDCVEQRGNIEWHIAWHYAMVEHYTTKHDVESYTVEKARYYANAA